MIITDGQKLTLGDETITMYLTPGHTDGDGLSDLFGQGSRRFAHAVAFLAALHPARVSTSRAIPGFQLGTRFRTIERAANSEGGLSTHPMYSNTMQKLAEMRDNPGAPNPFLESHADMDRYDKIVDACIQAKRDGAP